MLDLLAKWKRDTRGSLRRMELFQGIADAAVDELDKRAEWIELAPGARLSAKVDKKRGETYYFLAEGQIGVCEQFGPSEKEKIQVKLLTRWNAPDKKLEQEALSQSDVVHLTVFTAGDFFSDQYLSMGTPDRATAIDCVAVMHSILVAVEAAVVDRLARIHDSLAKALDQRNQVIHQRYRYERSPARQVVQNFFVKNNYSFARTLRVIDLDLCINCDGCERACAHRHGAERLHRKGPILGLLQFPVTCRTCYDHRCMEACGFNAISLKPSAFEMNRPTGEEIVLHHDKCVGCRACYDACPNGVITMVETPYTAKDFPKPIPYTDQNAMTNVEGLYLTGEATGTALIKLAINGGTSAAGHAAQVLKEARAKGQLPEKEGVRDIIVMGAGPGGLAAALKSLEEGLDYLCFDKGNFATTINNFPRHKIVMAQPAHIPLIGHIWFQDTTKEELIQKWSEIIEKTGIQIQHFEEVKSVKKGADGIFDVVTSKGSYRAYKVVLSPGTRGNPRKLGAKGEQEPRVFYTLTDPEPYKGKRVLVVGGGDSALEAAMTLADFGADSSLSYRGDKFDKAKQGNVARIKEYADSGKLKLILNSTVSEVSDGKATLKLKDGSTTIENDFVLCCLGALPPTKFFEDAGIKVLQPNTPEMEELAKSRGTRFYSNKCDHCMDFENQACVTACPTGAIMEVRPEEVFGRPDDAQRFAVKPFIQGMVHPTAAPRRVEKAIPAVAIGALVVGLLVTAIWVLERTKESFGSGRGLGLALGITGFTLMALASLYPFHSRKGVLGRVARTRFWLFLHIVAGLLGPLFITLHSDLQWGRFPGVAFYLMALVVLTGIVGRVISRWVRETAGVYEFDVAECEEERRRLFEDARGRRTRDRWHGGDPQALDHIDELWKAERDREEHRWPTIAWIENEISGVFFQLRLRHLARAGIKNRELRKRAVRIYSDWARVERAKLRWEELRDVVPLWKRCHFVLTILMFAVAVVHVVVALLFRVS